MTTAPRRAVHYGNRIGSEGGIASVLEVTSGLVVPGWSLAFVATYDQRTSARGGRLLVRAVVRVLLDPAEVVHVHLSERGSFVREGLLVVLARARRRGVVVTLHGSELEAFAAHRPGLVRGVLRCAHTVLALSTASATAARALLPGRAVLVVPNPVVVPAVPPPLPGGSQVLFAGEQGRRKGLDVLLEAWPRVRRAVPAAELVVVGAPADVIVGDRPGVRDLGLRTRAGVRELLLGSRVCVLPSRFEVLPMFLLEAMSLGRPVVVTPVGGIPALVGDAGLVVPVEDVRALADALVELLRDTRLAERLGGLGHGRVRDTSSTQRVARALAEVYDEVSGMAGIGGRTR